MKEVDITAEIADTANTVFPWLIHARRLAQSAYLLDHHSEEKHLYKDVRNVARMCAGMAVECYFKAYFVACGNKLHDGKKQKKFGVHALVEMAKHVGFEVDLEQERVLHYLSMWVRVKGRYPVPLKPDDMKIHDADKSANPFEEHLLVWNERSDEICVDIFREAELRIDALKKKYDKQIV
jgi:hypothetical protein